MRYLSTYAPGGGLMGGSIIQPGELPRFGDGRVLLFFSDGSWTVPADVTRVRVRVIGAGGGILPGGATSFGALISATGGGAASGDTPGAGGAGFGGDFQASGGAGGAGAGGGGGACGSQLGDGGAGGLPGAGGGGGGGGGACGGFQGGPGVVGGAGDRAGGWQATPLNPGSAYALRPDPYVTLGLSGSAPEMPFPFHSFPAGFACPPGVGGRGGPTKNVAPEPGAPGGLGGGGGGAGVRDGGPNALGGRGGGLWPWVPAYERASYNNSSMPTTPVGFIGGGLGGALGRAGAGGGGYAHGEFDVDPGQVFALTVPQPGAGGVTAQVASGGLIIVEF